MLRVMTSLSSDVQEAMAALRRLMNEVTSCERGAYSDVLRAECEMAAAAFLPKNLTLCRATKEKLATSVSHFDSANHLLRIVGQFPKVGAGVRAAVVEHSQALEEVIRWVGEIEVSLDGLRKSMSSSDSVFSVAAKLNQAMEMWSMVTCAARRALLNAEAADLAADIERGEQQAMSYVLGGLTATLVDKVSVVLEAPLDEESKDNNGPHGWSCNLPRWTEETVAHLERCCTLATSPSAATADGTTAVKTWIQQLRLGTFLCLTSGRGLEVGLDDLKVAKSLASDWARLREFIPETHKETLNSLEAYFLSHVLPPVTAEHDKRMAAPKNLLEGLYARLKGVMADYQASSAGADGQAKQAACARLRIFYYALCLVCTRLGAALACV